MTPDSDAAVGHGPLGKILLPLALTAGAALLLTGLLRFTWPDCLPSSPGAIVALIGTIATCAALLYTLSLLTKRPPWTVAISLFLVLTAAASAIWPFLWLVLCVLAFALVGIWVLQLIGLGKSPIPAHGLVAVSIGSILYGTAIELTASLPIHYPWVYAGAIVLPIVLGWRPGLSFLRAFFAGGLQTHSCRSTVRLTQSVVCSLGLVYMFVALLPEAGYDALVSHLLIPSEVATRARWHFDHHNFAWALMPKHADWLFTLAFMQGGETGARLLNSGCIIGCAMAIYCIVSDGAPRAPRTCALLAAALFLSMPLTFTEGSSLYVESVWTLYTLIAVGIYSAQSRHPASPTSIIAICLLLSATAATKPQGIVVSAILLAIMARWLLVGAIKAPARTWGYCVLAISLIALVPYMRSWALSGNPVFPFFNGFFKAAGFPSENFTDHRWYAPLGWDLVYTLQFHTNQFIEGKAGAAGFQWVALLPVSTLAALLSRNRSGIVLLIAAVAAFTIVFVFVHYLRYVFPALALMTAVIGLGIAYMPKWCMRASVSLAAACISLNIAFLCAASPVPLDMLQPTVITPAGRSRYVTVQLPYRWAVTAINSLNRDERPVAFLCAPFGALSRGLPLYATWYNHSFNDAVATPTTASELSLALHARRVAWILLDDGWGASEVRARVEAISDPVERNGSLQIRRLRD